MPPKKFSKIQNDFSDTVFIYYLFIFYGTFFYAVFKSALLSGFFFFNFEKVLFSSLKIELYENAADKHSGKVRTVKCFLDYVFDLESEI